MQSNLLPDTQWEHLAPAVTCHLSVEDKMDTGITCSARLWIVGRRDPSPPTSSSLLQGLLCLDHGTWAAAVSRMDHLTYLAV